MRLLTKIKILIIFAVLVTHYFNRDPEYFDLTIDCDKLIRGDRQEVLKRRFELNHSYSGNLNIHHCADFVQSRGYLSYPVSRVELDNRLAFILVVYKDLKQVERLLRSIYRQSNAYCIHIDKKARAEFRQGMENLTECLENVVILEKSYDVVWGEITTLLPEIDCMRLLAATFPEWKYVINLTGQEFPLRTNYELAMIAKALNGANWIEWESHLERYRYFWKTVTLNHVPYGLTLYKGPVHAFMSRGFAEYVVYNETARVLLDWLWDTIIPDETFYATLNFNGDILRVPGAFPHLENMKKSDLYTKKRGRRSSNRYKQWKPDICYGFYARNICIFSGGDIRPMVESGSPFANKFHSYYEPHAQDCLSEWIHNRAHSRDPDFDYDFYRNLDFVIQ